MYTVSSGTRCHTEENLYSDQIPKRIFVGFVRNSGINGTYQTNPFQFEHFDMAHITLSLGGTLVPGKELDWEEYKKGYSLICFDLSPGSVFTKPPLFQGTLKK